MDFSLSPKAVFLQEHVQSQIFGKKKQKPNLASMMPAPAEAPGQDSSELRAGPWDTRGMSTHLEGQLEKLTGHLHQEVQWHERSVPIVHEEHLGRGNTSSRGRPRATRPRLAPESPLFRLHLTLDKTSYRLL